MPSKVWYLPGRYARNVEVRIGVSTGSPAARRSAEAEEQRDDEADGDDEEAQLEPEGIEAQRGRREEIGAPDFVKYIGEKALEEGPKPTEHRGEPRKGFSPVLRSEPVVTVGHVDETHGHARQIEREREKKSADEERNSHLADGVVIARHPAVGLPVGAEVRGDKFGKRAVLPDRESEGGECRSEKEDTSEAAHGIEREEKTDTGGGPKWRW